MNTIQLSTTKREVFGKKVKNLRSKGLIPAVVYGRAFEAIAIQVPLKDFEATYKEAGESTVVQLIIGDEKYPVIIKDVVREPLKDALLHVDFYKVRLDEKITAAIPLNFIGEAPAVKELQGILVKSISELEVEAFPQDLPHSIDVDLATLIEMGSQIFIKDLKLSSKLTLKSDPESIIALVQQPVEEKAPETAPTIDDVQIGEKKEAVEGEEAVESEEPTAKEETKE